MKRFTAAIIGSHGYRAKYGGWDQLVNQIVDGSVKRDKNFLIYNSKDTIYVAPPLGSKIVSFGIHAHGIQGLLFDFISIIHAIFYTKTLFLLGAQGFPLALLLKILLFPFIKIKIIVNPGGIEWNRPKFNYLEKLYLRFVFNISSKFSDYFILDNYHYKNWIPNNYIKDFDKRIFVIPYGGDIFVAENIPEILIKYDLEPHNYFLSVSRALEDNCIEELCSTFEKLEKLNLVLISNFSTSEYGKKVYNKFSDIKNIILIDSLYSKFELDAIRLSCLAYIHTHTLCGSAPSLIEMIVCGRPIISVDVPQNRFTLNGEGLFYTNFDNLSDILVNSNIPDIPSQNLRNNYSWSVILNKIYCFL